MIGEIESDWLVKGRGLRGSHLQKVEQPRACRGGFLLLCIHRDAEEKSVLRRRNQGAASPNPPKGHQLHEGATLI